MQQLLVCGPSGYARDKVYDEGSLDFTEGDDDGDGEEAEY